MINLITAENMSARESEKNTLYQRFVRTAAAVIGIFDPKKASKYLRDHALYRAYDAAVTSYHHNENWRPGLRTGDEEIKKDWRVATERSRDLDRNHPLVNDALKVGFAFTIGSALNPQWNILKADKTRDEAKIRLIEFAHELWAEDCTIDGKDWRDVLRLVYRHLKIDGELFVVESADEFHPYKLQLIEASQVNDSIEGNLKNGNYAVRGIEFNKFGRPVAYNFYEAHPSGLGLMDKNVRVLASRVHHLFMPGRITETRGMCHFVSAIMSLYDQNELSDQILELHRLAAAYGLFVESETPEDDFAGMGTEKGPDGISRKIKSVGGIKLNYLDPDQKISAVKPEMPTGSFGEFDKTLLRKGARGFSMSYETFTGDFSNANFSTLKAGQNNERALFRLETDFIRRKFAKIVTRNWLTSEILRGTLPFSDYFTNKAYYQQFRFTLPALPDTDRVKEEIADRTALENKTITRRMICERKGIDYDETIDQLRQEENDIRSMPVAEEIK